MACKILHGIEAEYHDHPLFVATVSIRCPPGAPTRTARILHVMNDWLEDEDSGAVGFAKSHLVRASADAPLELMYHFTDKDTAFAFKMRWG